MKPTYLYLAALFALLPATSAATDSDELPQTVSLEQVLKLADERSPRTVAERATVEIVAADRVTAATLPNPSVSYGGLQLVGGVNTGSSSQHQVVVEQPLLLFNQRRERGELADLNVGAEQARVAASLAARRLEVRQAFTTLLARQQQQRILEESLVDLHRVEKVVRGRAAAGDRSQYDVARIEVQSGSLQVEVANASTDVDDASGRLAVTLGFPGWRPRANGDLQPASIPTDLSVLWETAQQRRPSLTVIRQRQAAAHGGLTLASRERWPVPALAAGPLITRDENSVSAFFGVSLPLALFDRNQGALARAAAEIAAESLALDAELAETRAGIERARTVLLQRRAALATLEDEVVQRLPALRKMAEDAYREGSGGILELLDALRALKDVRLLQLQQLEAVKLAEAEVVSVTGLDSASPSW